MCRCASRRRFGLLISIRPSPHRSIGIVSDPQCTKIHAGHLAENAMSDRDKNSPLHSRENGSQRQRLRWLRPKNIRPARLSANKSVVSLPQCLPERHQLAALSVPKHENQSVFHRLIPRLSDSVVLLATSALTFPSSVNATTACSGCRARCSQRIRLSFSAEPSGRYSPPHRRAKLHSITSVVFVWLGNGCACPKIPAGCQ